MAQSGVKGRNLNSQVLGTAGSIVGAITSGTVLRQVRALARREGKGHPPVEVPWTLRTRGYLTEYQDGCLSLWTPDQFELQMESMLERANSGRSDRNLVRLWASTSHELEIDKQGRMAIPSRLREYAGLVGDVLVLGAIDRVELWNRESWDQKVLPEEERLTQGDDG